VKADTVKLLSWLKRGFTYRAKALVLYRRGMLRAKRHKHSQAVEDYSAVIEMPHVPPDVRAMALYNRALVHAAAGDEARAAGDLREVLAAGGSPENVKTAARQKLVRMDRQHRRETV
jgi:hypothetical protein